jgi:hypothetical protein
LLSRAEFDCLNAGSDGECCQWAEGTELTDCTKEAVQNELYRAADSCCDEETETCSDDGWPKTCNLGCASIMVPLLNKCVSKFAALGLTASVAPLTTSVKACPCQAELQ